LAFVTGDSIGDYKVLDLVGSGGMGSVYRIEHSITKRIEAMKLLPLGLRSGPEELHRFEREIQVQARLQHPNIAAVYNAIRDGSSIALVMEYVQGESLQKKLERGKLPIQTALDYAGQMLDALGYAHENGVVHRDVSPANIVITAAGVAKLTDFGLARAVTDLRLTTTGVAVGCPWYMSPEQVRAVEEIDARADIYAAGAVLHEMLTGAKLFDAESSFAVMRAHTEATPKPPSAHAPGIPTALDQVVARAVAKDPAARFQTAGEFRVALDAIGAATQPSAIIARAARGLPLTATFFLLGFAALIASTSAVLLRPKAVQAPAATIVVPAPPAPIPPAPLLPAPPVAEPEPEAVVSEAPVERAKPVIRSRVPAVHPRRSAEVAEPIREVPAARPSVSEPLPIPEPPGPAPVVSAPSAEPVGIATPDTTAPPEVTASTPEQAKPGKTGNRFVRTLNKLNPFGKRGKN
jgi:hypothetical protein